MPAAASAGTFRLPRPLLRMKAPAEMRGAISGRVIGRPSMGPQCPVGGASTVGQRPRRDRPENDAAECEPARAASSARVRAGPAGFDARPDDEPPAPLAEPPEAPTAELPRRRRPDPDDCCWGAGAG